MACCPDTVHAEISEVGYALKSPFCIISECIAMRFTPWFIPCTSGGGGPSDGDGMGDGATQRTGWGLPSSPSTCSLILQSPSIPSIPFILCIPSIPSPATLPFPASSSSTNTPILELRRPWALGIGENTMGDGDGMYSDRECGDESIDIDRDDADDGRILMEMGKTGNSEGSPCAAISTLAFSREGSSEMLTFRLSWDGDAELFSLCGVTRYDAEGEPLSLTGDGMTGVTLCMLRQDGLRCDGLNGISKRSPFPRPSAARRGPRGRRGVRKGEGD